MPEKSKPSSTFDLGIDFATAEAAARYLKWLVGVGIDASITNSISSKPESTLVWIESVTQMDLALALQIADRLEGEVISINL